MTEPGQTPVLRLAETGDLPRLLDLMKECHAESGRTVDSRPALNAFAALLSDRRSGQAWIIQHRGEEAGYMVVSLGFSIIDGGRTAFLDELFVRPPFRGRGLGTAALDEARRYCGSAGVRAIHLEVGRHDVAAQEIYRKAGFIDDDRRLLTLQLAPPL